MSRSRLPLAMSWLPEIPFEPRPFWRLFVGVVLGLIWIFLGLSGVLKISEIQQKGPTWWDYTLIGAGALYGLGSIAYFVRKTRGPGGWPQG